MYRIARFTSISLMLVGAAVATAESAQAAALNLAAGAPEIAESGSWQSNPGTANDTSPFGGQNITNGGNSTPASLGLSNPGYTPVQEISSGDGTFWLPAQGSTSTIDGVASQGYVTINLGAQHRIGEIDLYNSHNGGYFDRGTINFQIDGGNAVDGSGHIINPHVMLTGTQTLGAVYGSSNQFITPDIFNAAGVNLGGFQYLTYIALSSLNSQPGLNEIRVFTALTPEPGSLLLMGLGLIGLAIVGRRMKK